jgi:hypothetical protein
LSPHVFSFQPIHLFLKGGLAQDSRAISAQQLANFKIPVQDPSTGRDLTEQPGRPEPHSLGSRRKSADEKAILNHRAALLVTQHRWMK